MGDLYATVQSHALEQPEKIAIISERGEAHSYRALLQAVARRYQKLAAVVRPGESRVAFSLHEGEELPVTVLALNRMGVTLIPLNPTLQVTQLESLLQVVKADVVVATKETVAPFEKLQAVSPTLIVVDHSRWTEEREAEYPEENLAYSPQKPFLITLSSGSTGDPKPIIFTEKNKLDRARQAATMYRVTATDHILCASPFFHSLGQRLTLLPLVLGATLVQLTRFTAKHWTDLVEQRRVTFTIPVSSHLHELVGTLIDQPHRFSTLRCLVSSSAAISNEVKQRLFDALTCDFHEMYGASEVATATDLNREQAIMHGGSVGIACSGVSLRIVDDAGSELPPKQIGEITVQSPLASPGYDGLPEVTESSFIDGYFHTGDLGYLDEEGYLYFVNRKKEMIISGGMNIYPSDIENVLAQHAAVQVAVVVAIDDSFLGEVAVAVIIPSADSRFLERELRGLVRQHLSPYQHPMRYFFRDALPMTASGKVDKRALQDELNGLKLELSAKLRALQGD